jgi:hypothetical protein
MRSLVSTAGRLKSTLLAALVSGGFVLADNQSAEAIIPVVTVNGAGSCFTDVCPPVFSGNSSYGYFFDLNGAAQVDALGLYVPLVPDWTSGTYTVSLWSYNTLSNFTLERSATFDAASLPSYTIVGSYAWLDVPVITLVGTPSDPNLGYILGAYGSFTSTPGGQLGFITTTAPGASFDFASPFFTEGNGFSQSGVDASYPVPYVFSSDPALGLNGEKGYFNPNLSLVPGPLPVLGAAAGFGWTRRLRKRIRASK